MGKNKYIRGNLNEIQGGEDSRLERIRRYVSENPAKDLSIAAITRQFELSASTLMHIFKKNRQQSYHQYVEKTRMNKAMELLKKGKWVKEMMHATGYKNRTTFLNAFKRKFKYSPRYFQQ